MGIIIKGKKGEKLRERKERNSRSISLAYSFSLRGEVNEEDESSQVFLPSL